MTWSDVVSPAPGNTPGQKLFEWEVNFAASAADPWLVREMWLVQSIENIWDVDRCDRQPYEGWTKGVADVTPKYWEAWWIDEFGDIRIPKSTSSPPSGTATPAGADDKWVRQPATSAEPTRGFWNMRAELFVVATLPSEFGIGKVPDARHLASTAVTPSANFGAPLAVREVGGLWSFCDAANPLHTLFL